MAAQCQVITGLHSVGNAEGNTRCQLGQAAYLSTVNALKARALLGLRDSRPTSWLATLGGVNGD
jgi:hypothetical protein